MTFDRRDPRRARRNLDPAPAEVLGADVIKALTAWRRRWGALIWTREPSADRVLLRLDWVKVPLIELDGQRCYDGLQFLAWRQDHGGLTS